MSETILKPCRRCKCMFPRDSFPSYVQLSGRQKGRTYWSYLCPPCQKDHSKETYIKNKEKIKCSSAEYIKNNKEKVKASRASYFQRNKEKLYEKKRLWKQNNREKYLAQKKRQKQLPHNKIKRKLANRIKKLVGGESSRDISVGCGGKFLTSHIESKFLAGMSWNNYGWGEGKWVIDHIKPLSMFNVENKEERYSANHYLNLQPLWYSQNEAKSDNYDPDHPMGWHGLNELLSEEDKKLLGKKYNYDFGQNKTAILKFEKPITT